jgi:sec-independent protein translocase protein TatC
MVNSDSKMSFLEHLEELRNRLIICAVALIGGMVICWFIRDPILKFLLAPLFDAWRQVDGLEDPTPLNFTSMLEPFTAYLKLSAIGGIFVSAPVILYQLWKFIAPGLYPKEKRMAIPFVAASTLLFVGGSAMAYSMVFPIGFRFFLEFAAGQEMTETDAHIPVGEEASCDFSEAPPDMPLLFDTDPDAGEHVIAPPKKKPRAEKENRNTADTAVKPPTLSEKPSAPPTPDDDRPGWFVSIMNFFFTEDCGSLGIRRSDDQQGAELSIAWHRGRCGPLPSHIKVRRDGELIYPVWERQRNNQSDDKDLERFLATDIPPGNGTYAYVVKVPKNPNAHRLMPMLTIQEYLSLAIRMMLAFGIVFELPILISFLAIAGIVNYKQLIKFFRYYVVITFVAAAVLTPSPDAVSQCLLAGPLLLLYGISIIVAFLFGEKPT